MTDFISDFLAHMRAHGFEPVKPIVADDKWHSATFGNENPKNPSGTYSLKIEGDRAVGCVFSRKDDSVKYGWNSASNEKLTPEEKRKLAKEREKKQREKEAAELKHQQKISRRLTRWFKSLPKATDDHPYLKRKGINAHGLRLRKKGNELVMPLYGADGKIWTIQRITESGGKYLFKGGKKQGSYYPLGTSKDDTSLIYVCEGFATGASIKEATGKPVIVAIDSGNIKHVMIALKAKYPNSRFVICADNDAFTMKPDGVTPWNVGIEKAHEAAAACGGAFVVSPDFSALSEAEYKNNRYTDFNDLQIAFDTNEVERQIVAKIPAPSNQQDTVAASDENPPVLDQHTGGDDVIDLGPQYEPADHEYDFADAPAPMTGDFGMNFKILGYNEGVYYYFPFRERQIVALTPAQHTLPNLFRLDNLDNWMSQFGSTETSEKKVVMYATNALMETARARGVFVQEARVRGCGAWIDAGRKVLHCGDMLYVDGVPTQFDQLESEYTYVAASRLMRPESSPLSDKEAYALRLICEAVTWESKLSGTLLAGWLVIAPICGALSFRPHIYITGEAESGKSTVLNKIIKPVLGKIGLEIDGGTTEPATRQLMGYNARPVVYDEAEKSVHMTAVIELARKSSVGGNIKKFGQGMTQARSCFCFSAINPPVKNVADESRISFMTIKKNRRPTAMEEYNDLLDNIERVITPEFSGRLMARTLDNMDSLFENIKIFQRAARRVVKSARAAEMIGNMLAGVYLLSRTDVIKEELAQKWIEQHDWTRHTIIDQETDPVRLLQYMSSSTLRLQTQGAAREYSVGDLIRMVHTQQGYWEEANKLLRYNGIAVKGGRVYIASRSAHLEKMLRDTDWSIKWTPMLSNLEGSEQFATFYFSVGFKTSGVSLPISLFAWEEDDTPRYIDRDKEAELTF